ncbi:mannose-1-phosphate guanylyltransferase/mannose-6-phosphate isomerase, partial [Gammaproteobacteria bacterium]|nr:mannose-1-phosphate guanylyltransferase/mannose-6-phosphate isomerase [Gammaproteobacteria bacterium]
MRLDIKIPTSDITAVIMAGGSGSRLWPLSREERPKQFLSLDSNETMLMQTINRIRPLIKEELITVCSQRHRLLVSDLYAKNDIKSQNILEPFPKNTAPAIALAALTADKEELLLFLPADHQIREKSILVQTIKNAETLAKQGKLVIFGIEPHVPHTGYGYIEKGAPLGSAFEVKKFKEKPNHKIAAQYLESENFLWNSGMFLFKAGSILTELEKYCPELLEVCRDAIKNAIKDDNFLEIDSEIFAKCSKGSIDTLVMERTQESLVFPLDAGWSDLGTWFTIWENFDKDQNGNVILGDAILEKTNDCIVNSDDKLVAVLGSKDLVIVDTKDALLVADKREAQNLGMFVDKLKSLNRQEVESTSLVERPWGNYESLRMNSSYQVKQLMIRPGESISVQKHEYRSEHWIVIQGFGEALLDGDIISVSSNDHLYIEK